MKKYFIILVLIILFIMSIFLNFNRNSNEVCINDKCFLVEVVKSKEERNKGLMYRESLAKNEGMLFVFDKEEEHSFWMMNTLIPLDIIWINKDKEVVFIYDNAKPCKEECESIKPEQKSLYVLEINAGEADFKIGDKVKFSF
jgi:hypothetical protein